MGGRITEKQLDEIPALTELGYEMRQARAQALKLAAQVNGDLADPRAVLGTAKRFMDWIWEGKRG